MGRAPRCTFILCAVCQVRSDNFADASHGLRIARHHADGAQIMQDIFGRDSLLPDAAFGERDVFGNLRIQVMADHQHVEMLGDGVHG